MNKGSSIVGMSKNEIMRTAYCASKDKREVIWNPCGRKPDAGAIRAKDNRSNDDVYMRKRHERSC